MFLQGHLQSDYAHAQAIRPKAYEWQPEDAGCSGSAR